MSTPTRAGRPRAFDTDQALSTALELFWRDGYAATSTRDLEAALGISQSSLYNAFGSKAELLATAMDRYEAAVDAHLVAPLLDAEEGLSAIAAFFDALRQWVADDGRRGCMVINLMVEDGALDQAITARTTRYRQRVREALRVALGRAVVRGEIDGEHLEARTDLLFGMVLGLNVAVRGGADRDEVDRLLAAVRTQVEAW